MRKKIKIESSIIEEKIIGIVGGVGPEASNKFCEFLIKNKKSNSDQEHLVFLHYCNPKIPDRTKFILGLGDDPKPEIIKTCKILQDAGAIFLVIPCNTAHAFLKEIQESVDIPIIDMTKVMVKKLVDDYPGIKKVGILATTGSLKAGIYQDYLSSVGINPIIPSENDQKRIVMDAIYGLNGIKAGKKVLPKKKLTKIANKLISEGAEALILGCTEIPLVLKQKSFNIPIFDPMEIVAKEIISYLEEEKEENYFITVNYFLSRPLNLQKLRVLENG
jgi:aspartate racemase